MKVFERCVDRPLVIESLVLMKLNGGGGMRGGRVVRSCARAKEDGGSLILHSWASNTTVCRIITSI